MSILKRVKTKRDRGWREEEEEEGGVSQLELLTSRPRKLEPRLRMTRSQLQDYGGGEYRPRFPKGLRKQVRTCKDVDSDVCEC